MKIAVGVLQAFAMVGGPLALAMLLRKKWRVSWSLFGFGALAFFLSKVVQLPLGSWLGPKLGTNMWVRLPIIFLLAPLCEEGARWICFRYFAKRAKSWREGLFVGLGHGGFESMILGVLGAVALAGAMTVPESAAEATYAKALLEAPPLLRLMAVLERVAAVMLHLGASLLVLRAVRDKRPIFLLAAMGLHYLFNGAGVTVGLKFGPIAATAVFLVVAALPLAIILLSKPASDEASDQQAPAPDIEMGISCRDLTRQFGDRMALNKVSLDIAKGELFALLGPNGAGKTTMVRTLCGLIPPTSGRASVAGYEVGVDDDSLRGAVGALTEVPALYEQLSPMTNLQIFGQLEGVYGETLTGRIEKLLRGFELWERRDDPVGSFSKGMRQKVSIARALLHEPPVLFLDEPTSGLDPSAAHDLSKLIQELKTQGHTILLTTHRLEEAESLAERVGILKGELLAVDTVEGLRTRVYGQRVRVRFVEAPDNLLELVNATEGVAEASWDDPELVADVERPDESIPELVRTLVEAGAAIRSVDDSKESLEDVYLELIREEEPA